jgi:NTP pyrophosphatase (non-canonical NTP hydrolase)
MALTFLDKVRAEVHRAQRKFPGQEDSVPLAGWLSILTEEVGEVARELNEKLLVEEEGGEINKTLFLKRLEEELVQVAAMAERMSFASKRQLS